MSVMQEAQLKAGRIFGDQTTKEYVYMPAGEIGTKNPVCVYETENRRASWVILCCGSPGRW